MTASREELQQRLATLETAMPSMVKDHPDLADFHRALSEHADYILEHADGDDAGWALLEIARILDHYGFDIELEC